MNFFDLIFTSLFITAIFAAGIVVGALGAKNPTVIRYVRRKIDDREI